MNFIQKTLTTVLAVGTLVATAPGAEAGSFRDNAEAQASGREARKQLCTDLYEKAPITLSSGHGVAYQLQDGTIIRVDKVFVGWDSNGRRIPDCKAWKMGVVDQVFTYVYDYGQITWELGWEENTRADEWANNRWLLKSYTQKGEIRQQGNLRYGRSMYDQQAVSGLNQLLDNFTF